MPKRRRFRSPSLCPTSFRSASSAFIGGPKSPPGVCAMPVHHDLPRAAGALPRDVPRRRIPDMMARLMFVLFTPACLFAQCDDVGVSTKQAKHLSEVVFQGAIEGFGGSGADRTVIFRVSRVWKGRVGATFEMPAIETGGSLCTAFWHGLLVIAERACRLCITPLPARGQWIFSVAVQDYACQPGK
jgi:hypothetical protein